MNEKQFLIEVGHRIRKARQEAGLSQEQLAELIGKTQNTISAYETGLHAMRIAELPQFAHALRITMSELLGERILSTNEMFVSPDKYLEALFYQLDDRARKFLIRDVEEIIELQKNPDNLSVLLKGRGVVPRHLAKRHLANMKKRNLTLREKKPELIAYDLFIDARSVFEDVKPKVIQEKIPMADFVDLIKNYGYRFTKDEFSIKTFASLLRVDVEPLRDILRHLGYEVED